MGGVEKVAVVSEAAIPPRDGVHFVVQQCAPNRITSQLACLGLRLKLSEIRVRRLGVDGRGREHEAA